MWCRRYRLIISPLSGMGLRSLVWTWQMAPQREAQTRCRWVKDLSHGLATELRCEHLAD